MAYQTLPPAQPGELEERTITIDRVSRTVKGGKRMRFRALVVVGDRRGRIGVGIGKASEVPLAVGKASTSAKKHLMTVPIHRDSIAHAVTAKYGSTSISLWPATPGTSIIAGGPVRAVLELAGIRNILGKLHGSTNKTNAVRATLAAFEQLAASKRRTTVDRGERTETQNSEFRIQNSGSGSPTSETPELSS